MATKPYISITNADDIISASVSHSHSSAVSTASFECISHSLELGDLVEVTMGQDFLDAGIVFIGYVKQITHSIPSNTYTILLSDKLIRAVDFFIVADNQSLPLTFSGISGEDLIEAVLALASLENFDGDTTMFTFGINTQIEVNLVSSFDFANQIANILTYSFWYDYTGDVVKFKNRKPYTVESGDPETTQPGVIADVTTGKVLSFDDDLLTISHTISERDLRNKVVVYGANDISAIEQEPSPYLPTGFYKSSVFGAPMLIGDQETADLTAEYNLLLLHRLTRTITCSIPGDHEVQARTCLTVNVPSMSIENELWYIFSVTHTFSVGGFYTELELRRSEKGLL